MSEVVPLVSWETKLIDVLPVIGEPFHYTCKVASINPNDYSPNTLGTASFYVVDYLGKIYQIVEIVDLGTKTIKIYDLIEDVDEGPYLSESAFVYKSRGVSNALTQAQRKRLHPSAIDMIWNIENNILSKNTEGYKVYSGFVNRTDSSLSMVGDIFTLVPTGASYDVYTNGILHTISSTLTVQITEDRNITYVYIDIDGNLQKTTTMWDLESGNAPCAIIFKDGSLYALTDERHGYDRNRPWHKWAHRNIGAMYNGGLEGVFTNNSLTIQEGEIADEDLNHSISGPQSLCSLWYRAGAIGMRLVRNSSTPYAINAGVLQYDDGDGALTDVSNNRYVTNWVYGTGDSTEPIYIVVGQNNSVNIANARNAAKPTINLSTAEWKLLYAVIYRNVGGNPTYIEAIDYRTVQTGVPTLAVTTTHASLTERDVANSHPASAISYDNGSETLSDVQTELDELNNAIKLKQPIFTYTV